MKFYYYAIISIGIMLTLALAGVDGIGTNVRTLFIDNETNTMIQPATQYNGSIGSDPMGVVNDIKSTSTSLWTKFLLAMLGMALLGGITGVQILGSGISLDVRRMLMAIISYGIFGIFASDMWTLVTLVFSYGTDWISWFMGVIIATYIAGFAIACLEFVGGAD